ncbi:MAG: LysR substrate-binding domain-containing protein [Victivallaceae bacterium]|nr:LysR substrate-binding domain-containing protein [Victivallaceae bacterium]
MIDRKLEIFRMAATLCHFSEAADALGMTQPNVTSQIARLEEELGTKLFARDSRRVTLLPAGETLLCECQKLFDEERHLKRMVRNAAEGVRHYWIGGTMTAGGFVLPSFVAAYMREHARQRLCIQVGDTDEIVALLKRRQLDLALVEGPFDRELFSCETLCEDELIPAWTPGFLPDGGDAISLAEYLKGGGKFVLREKGSGTRFYFDLFLRRNQLPDPAAEAVIEVNNFDAVKLLVRGGYGMTVISPLAVADEVAAGTLMTARFTEGRILRKLEFLYLPGEEKFAFAEEFIRYCRHARNGTI